MRSQIQDRRFFREAGRACYGVIFLPNVLTVSTFIAKEFEKGSVSVGMAMAMICVLLTTATLIILKYFVDGEKD